MMPKQQFMCALTIIPVRAMPKDASEIVTQLLFGETGIVLEKKENWLKIQIHHDNYLGWIDEKQVIPLDDTFTYSERNHFYQHELSLMLKTPWENQRVLQGSPVLSTNTSFQMAGNTFEWEHESPQKRDQNLIEIALSYLNTPYLWGGRTWYGIDCSGFTQTVFHQLGKFISRDASQQIKEGETVTFTDKKPGDVAFFHSEKTGNITHVGIVLADQKIIHAHGHVRIDTLDQKGIFNTSKKYYSHPLNKIIRIHY